PDELRAELFRHLPAGRRLPGPGAERQRPGADAGRAADRVPADREPGDLEGPRAGDSRHDSLAGRPVDRVRPTARGGRPEDRAMRRRGFITLLGGAAAAWATAARAQQPERLRRIGVLMGYPENDPEGTAFFAAFREGLEKLGWVE